MPDWQARRHRLERLGTNARSKVYPTERSSRCELNLYGVKLGFGIKAFVSRHREILVS